ncbi:MAG: hypothetical protein IKJ01_07915 [Lachnospiraceae bacterium]|nr:hypothetical protein [Lachnospiraceae bacterium]
MLVTGTHMCQHCNYDIEWEYQIPQRLRQGVLLDVDRIDKKKAHPQKLNKINDNEYLFEMRCKKCDRLTTFTHYSEIPL